MYPILEHKYYGIHVKEQIEAVTENCPVESDLYFINGFEKKTNYLKSILSLKNLLKKKQPDIIHIHFGLSGFFLLFFKPRKSKIVLTLHGSDFNATDFFKKKIMNKIFQKVDGFIVVNDLMLNRLSETFERVAKIPCGINTDFFRPDNSLKNDKSSNKYLIGFPGDPNRIEKNYPLFKEVIEELKKKGLGVEICVFNNMTREEVRDNLNKIDLLLLTSHSEGSPQIIKEALACNTAVVSVQVGDVEQMMTGVENCLVCKNHNAVELADASLQVLKKSGVYTSGESILGREKISKIRLDNISVSGRIFDFYKRLL
jgi:glycosyltransferase involved in cell wall biosynthesis